MEITEIATLALGYATPYLAKTGEKLAEQAGEGMWKLITKPFKSEEERAIVEHTEITSNFQEMRASLISKLETDNDFCNLIIQEIERTKETLQGIGQNINNYGTVGKQLYIKDNSGPINM